MDQGDRANRPESREVASGGLDQSASPTIGSDGPAGTSRGPARHGAPGQQLGPYAVLAELGRGGMGVVYRARHLETGGEVALKVLIAGQDATDEQLKRFEREAAIARTLADHPGIVGVRDAGLDGGRAWFAMDLVTGRSLDDELAARECSFREIAGWIEGAARAVHFAHANGVLHRDLKPANVLIDAGGTARVTDFGLAKQHTLDASATRLTGSGQILGTPAYMSPEQAEGAKACDARSDMYSLGATLYEALVGEPPFLGDTVYAVLARVLRDDPVPPRRRRHDVPRDVDTITLKCLEKRPEQRYATAEDLADDLRRWLDGQPIEAKPLGVAQRTGRQFARRKTLVAAAVAAGLAAIAGVGYWVARRQAATAHEAAATARAQMLAQLRQSTGDNLSAALDMRRAGLVDKMPPYLAKTEAACREAMTALPDAPEPHYHLGRMHRAAMDEASAWAAQHRALARDPEFAPARYERALLASRRYRARVDELRREELLRLGMSAAVKRGQALPAGVVVPDRAAAARRDAMACETRRTIDDDVRWLTCNPRTEPAEIDVVRALVAWLDDDRNTARSLLESAVGRHPGMEEAVETLAAIEIEAERFEAALRVLSAGARHDLGYAPYPHEQGRTRSAAARRATLRGEDARDTVTAAIADFDRSLELTTSVGAVLADRADAWGFLALLLSRRGEDPVAAASRGVEDARAAEQAPAVAAMAARRRVGCLLQLADHERRHGRAAQAQYDSAILAADRAVQLDPASAGAWGLRAAVRINAALLVGRGDGDPTVLCESAHADVEQALARDPTNWEWWVYRGNADLNIALFRMRRGEPCETGYQRAIESFGRVVELEPDLADGYTSRGQALVSLGVRQANTGMDPRPVWQRAISDLQAARDRDGGSVSALLSLGWAHRNLARRLADPRDRAAGYAAAVEAFESAVRVDDTNAEAWSALGQALSVAVRATGQPAEEVEAAFRRAVEACERALLLQPGPSRQRDLASVLVNWGMARWSDRDSAVSIFRRALDAFSVALRDAPLDADALSGRGGTYVNLALLEPDPGAAIELLEKGVADLDGGLAIAPDALLWRNRGHAARAWALALRRLQQEARPRFREALQAYEEAGRLDAAMGRRLQSVMQECRAALEGDERGG